MYAWLHSCKYNVFISHSKWNWSMFLPHPQRGYITTSFKSLMNFIMLPHMDRGIGHSHEKLHFTSSIVINCRCSLLLSKHSLFLCSQKSLHVRKLKYTEKKYWQISLSRGNSNNDNHDKLDCNHPARRYVCKNKWSNYLERNNKYFKQAKQFISCNKQIKRIWIMFRHPQNNKQVI